MQKKATINLIDYWVTPRRNGKRLMVQTPSKPITLEEFLRLPETKPASEFIDGNVIQKPMPQGQHSRLQQKLVTAINMLTEEQQIALALPLRCTFGGRSIVPDIAVFIWKRILTNDDGTIANSFDAHPNWTIEILSPEQSSTRVTSNILHCLNHGTQLGWLIDPNEQLVLGYAPGQQPNLFESPSDRLPMPKFAHLLHLTLALLFSWLKIR